MAELLQRPAKAFGAIPATKLHIPMARPGLVPRQGLVELLVEGAARKLTLIEAPPGYGKTTLLAEWCVSSKGEGPFAWLSLDEGDNDPVRFWTGVIDGIRTVEPDFGEAASSALEARNIDLVEVLLPLILNDLTALARRSVLVLDDYHLVREDKVHRSVAFLLDHLPETLHVALATRVDPPLPVARMRARGEMTEIRAADLRLSDEEAAELLRLALGLDLDVAAVAHLQQRTEGWAAGLYLAALSLRGRQDAGGFIDSFAGDERNIVDYLSSEVLAGQSNQLRDFLLRTSILDQLCGPLCDAVTDAEGSARLLNRIESWNLFLVPLDATRTWYRYHHLFGELLRHELALAEPEIVTELHRRASAWYRTEGSVSEAIHHAAEAAAFGDARELIALHWNDYFNRGTLGTVTQWLDGIPAALVGADPRLCVARAWLALDRGKLEEAREWIEAATAATASDAGPEVPDSIEADIGVLRAVQGFKSGELEKARSAALGVLEATGEEDTFPRTVANLMLGVTLYWSGEHEEAATALRDAARLAEADQNDLGQSYALGYLALVAIDRGEIDDADRVGSEAIGLSEDPGFTEHFVAMIGHLACGRAAEQRGLLDDAERTINRAGQLSRRGAGRIEVAAGLLALAELGQLKGDRDEARAALRDARSELERCADPGTLSATIGAVERRLRATAPGAVLRAAAPEEELTNRELAVLRLLDSALSRPEIANALYVSTNTVKTHVRGIYRKLDASTRKEAVARARELGLL